jgi:hypothetical protein
MAEVETDDRLLDSEESTETDTNSTEEELVENVEESNDENAEESNPKDPTDFGDEISADDLGIDLDSLTMNAPNVLGKANPKPSLTSSASEKRSVGRPPKEDEGLFAWCEQFSYTPGVDYLKLHRLYPKTWEGMSIGGFIEEVYEPIDEHWLAERWGGGSFQLEAYQRDSTGRSRKTQVKHIEISGLPKSFMGTDGRVHQLPPHSSLSNSSRRSSDVLRRRMGLGRFRNRDQDDDRYEEYDDSNVESMPPRPRPTQNVDKPLADASALYKVLQDTKRSENDALGVLRDAQKDVHTQMQATSQQQTEMYKTLLEQQKEEMRRVREESRHAAENSSAPFKEMLQFMASSRGDSSSRENLDALRSAHDSAIQSLSREHSTHLDDLRRSSESRQTQLMDELNRTRTEYAQQIERFRSEYLEKEKSAKDDAFRHYQTQLTILQTQNSESRERHRDELSNALREKNELITQLRQDLQDLRTNLNNKDHTSRMSLIERENAIRQEYNERERTLNERILKLESTAKQDLLEERQRMKEEFEDRYTAKLEAMKTAYDTRIDTITATAELKVQSAQKEAKLISENAQNEAKSQVGITKKETQAHYESQITRLEAQLESMRSEHNSREQLSLERSRLEQESAQKERENQRLILESTAQSKEVLAEMNRKQLESKVRELQKDLERTKKEQEDLASSFIPESNDPFEQLEKLNAIKDRLKAHGFIDSSDNTDKPDEDKEPEEEKPKDFLGKILHYGPQFIGPILQRVDAATQVAQQAVTQQQQQQVDAQEALRLQAQMQAQEALKSKEQMIAQQRQLEYEQNAAIERENALRERREMLIQRRQEREQSLAEEQQRIAMAQQIELARQQSQTTEPSEPNLQVETVIADEPTEVPQAGVENTLHSSPNVEPLPQNINTEMESEMTPTEQDAFKQLADYVNKSISEKKKANSVVNELKMASMMGMFSKEDMSNVVNRDFEELVTIMSGFHSNLRTPKARTFMKTIVEGMKK